MFESHHQEIADAIAADLTGDGFIYDMFDYELANHEYAYTQDLSDTLDALNLTVEKVNADSRFLHALQKAAKAQTEWYEQEISNLNTVDAPPTQEIAAESVAEMPMMGWLNMEVIKRNFYDLEKLKSIPIHEVAQAYGVSVKKVGNDYWCAIRQERTASCKLYTKTNSFCDFGAANYGGDTIELTAFLNSCSRENAIEILTNTFGIQPENPLRVD